MHQKVREAEGKFQEFKLEKGIIGLEERKSELASKITAASEGHLRVRLERIEAELALKSLREAMAAGPVAATPAFTSHGSKSIAAIKSKLDEAKMELREKLATFKPKHPVIVKIKEDIRLLEAQLGNEERETIRAQQNRVESLRANEKALLETLEAYKEDVQKLNTVEMQYSILEREVETSRELYNLLMERRKKSTLSSGVSRRRISIVEPAIVPRSPMAKRMSLKVAASAIIGLIVGVGLAFLIEYLEMMIKTPEEIEKHLGLWVAAMIPSFESKVQPVLSVSKIKSQAIDKKSKRGRT
jgi:uncharacterized protein involved in exopolysaccharide biosynthesis